MVDTGILIVGQLGRDLVLSVEQFPEAGASTEIRTRHEMLGGKGTNQAVGMVQLGAPVSLLGVAGADTVGDRILTSAQDDGLQTQWVVRRGTSALLLDIVGADGVRRLFEHVPPEALLTADDITDAREAFRAAETVCLQLQQPPEALLEACRLATDAGARIVLDGAVQGPEQDQLLGTASVLRADAHEAQLLTGVTMDDAETAVAAAQRLLDRGLEVVAFGVEGAGDVVVWAGGHRFFPFQTHDVVDTTGAGDAFLAGLVTGLRAGNVPDEAGDLAAACAASTVQRLGGRPDLADLLRPS